MERLRNCGGSLTIPCKGSLIVPSGNIDTLPLLNEFNLDPRRLTTAQSPLGGVNGLVDYAPGSVHVTEGDGIYLTDVAGNNTSKDLPAGLLSRLGYLTIDTVAHTITEEFIVSNTATSNNPTVIDACDSTTGWGVAYGTGTISVENGRIKADGNTDSLGRFILTKTFNFNASTFTFIGCSIESSISSTAYIFLNSSTGYKLWSGSRFAIALNSNTGYVLPMGAPQGNTTVLPTSVSGPLNQASIGATRFGVETTANTPITIYIDNITADVAKSAYIETATPDNITSVVYQIWNGSTYNTNYMANMDPFSFIFSDPTQMVLNDGTKFDDVYGSSLGRSLFAKGASGQTVNGSLTGTTMTYSAVRGTKNRIGFRVDLPPSDGGRTAFNQCRIKKIIYYTDVNKASNVLPDISGNGNNGTMSQVGLTADNMGNPYGAMSFNGVNSFVDCGTNSALHFSNSFTVSAVVKMPSAPLVDQCLIVSDYRGAYKGYEIYINATRNVRFRVGRQSTSSINSVSSSQTLSLDTYYTITGVYDGIKSCVYVNGAVTNGPDFSPIEAENGPTYIGKAGWGSLYYTGIATNIRLYSRALSAEEVTALSNNQPVPSTGLVAQWQPSPVSHMGQSTQEFSNDNNASTGLLNVSKPWLAIHHPPQNAVLKDSSGNGNDGRMYEVNYVPDNLGNPYGAMSFDGVRSYVNCGSGNSLVFGNGTTDSPFSLCTRVRLTSVAYADFFVKYIDIGNAEYYLITSGGKIYFRCFDSSAAAYIGRMYNNSAIPADTWLDIVATYDGSCSADGFRIYLNGSRVDDANANAGTYTAMEDRNLALFIGKNPVYYQNGLSANNRIYSRVLSPTEVTALYNNQPVSTTGLVASWTPPARDANIDYYLFTERPTSLSYKRDESGNIYEVIVNPGNGLVYKGSTVWANNTLDTNSDSKPDMLDATIQNSIAQMLSVYGFNR